MARKKTSEKQMSMLPSRKAGPRGPRSGPNKAPEKDLVAKPIIDFLRTRGWTCTRQQSGLFVRSAPEQNGKKKYVSHPFAIGEKGQADWRAERRVNLGGKPINAAKSAPLHQLLYIETKRLYDKPKPHQLKWLRNRRETGTPAEWFDSFESFQEYYKKMGFDAWV